MTFTLCQGGVTGKHPEQLLGSNVVLLFKMEHTPIILFGELSGIASDLILFGELEGIAGEPSSTTSIHAPMGRTNAKSMSHTVAREPTQRDICVCKSNSLMQEKDLARKTASLGHSSQSDDQPLGQMGQRDRCEHGHTGQKSQGLGKKNS